MNRNARFFRSTCFWGALTIAVVQAVEVLERVDQILIYRWKFKDEGSWLPAITSGTTATGLFVAGTLLGIALAVIGCGQASRSNRSRWRGAYMLPLVSLVLFGALWIILILSPLVTLHSR